jgi:hypothetical protein
LERRERRAPARRSEGAAGPLNRYCEQVFRPGVKFTQPARNSRAKADLQALVAADLLDIGRILRLALVVLKDFQKSD